MHAPAIGHPVQEPVQRRRGQVEPGMAVPFRPLGDAHLRPERGHLVGRHQARVVVLVPGERQAPALDRVGDEAVRPVVGHTVERVQHGLDVMAAEIGHERRQRLVVMGLEQPPDEAVGAKIALDMGAPRRPALKGQRGIEVVRAGVDPLPEHLAAGLGKGGLELLAVLDRDDVPAHRAEELLDLGEQLLGHHPVQALPVVVDHPPEIADIVLPAFEQGLEDVALVELGVADDGDHPAGRLVGGHEAVQPDIVLGQRGEERHRGAEADRAGREIDRCRVLGPGRIGLGTTERAEALHGLLALLAQQVVRRVHDRAGMRLDRDPIAGAQHVEEECRHDGRDRGAGGLVAADLELVAAGPEMVGVVDGPGCQPEQLLLDGRQQVPPLGRIWRIARLRLWARARGRTRHQIVHALLVLDVRREPAKCRTIEMHRQASPAMHRAWRQHRGNVMADDERSATAAEPSPSGQQEAMQRQVVDIVTALPFEDDPSTFARVLRELADAHALDDEE